MTDVRGDRERAVGETASAGTVVVPMPLLRELPAGPATSGSSSPGRPAARRSGGPSATRAQSEVPLRSSAVCSRLARCPDGGCLLACTRDPVAPGRGRGRRSDWWPLVGSTRHLGQRGRPRAKPRRGRGAGSPCAPASAAVRRALRCPASALGEAARDAGGGRHTTGVACPARRGTGAWRRRPSSGAAVRGSREEPSSRTRPAPRGRQISRIGRWRNTDKNRETPPSAHSRRAPSQRSAVSPMGYPAPLGRRTLGRVARAAQHLRVGDVERCTASGERHDVVDGQVGGSVGGALVARAPVAALTPPGTEHPGAEPLPGPRAVQGVVPAAVGLAGVRRAPTT